MSVSRPHLLGLRRRRDDVPLIGESAARCGASQPKVAMSCPVPPTFHNGTPAANGATWTRMPADGCAMPSVC